MKGAIVLVAVGTVMVGLVSLSLASHDDCDGASSGDPCEKNPNQNGTCEWNRAICETKPNKPGCHLLCRSDGSANGAGNSNGQGGGSSNVNCADGEGSPCVKGNRPGTCVVFKNGKLKCIWD